MQKQRTSSPTNIVRLSQAWLKYRDASTATKYTLAIFIKTWESPVKSTATKNKFLKHSLSRKSAFWM